MSRVMNNLRFAIEQMYLDGKSPEYVVANLRVSLEFVDSEYTFLDLRQMRRDAEDQYDYEESEYYVY